MPSIETSLAARSQLAAGSSLSFSASGTCNVGGDDGPAARCRRFTTRLLALPGVTAVHDLHVWTLTSGIDAMSCHLIVSDLTRAGETLALVEALEKAAYFCFVAF